MENNNSTSVKDERVAKYISRHNITNMTVMYLVWFGYKNELPEEVIELYGKKEYDEVTAEAKYTAVMMGLSDVEDIQNYSDIRKKIEEATSAEIVMIQEKQFETTNQKIDMLNEKMNLLAEEKEQKNDMGNISYLQETADNLEMLAERVTSGISNMESGIGEGVNEVKEILIQCVNSILELSECNLSLLKASYDEQEILKSFAPSPVSEMLSAELDALKVFWEKGIEDMQKNIVEELRNGNAPRKSIFSYLTGKQQKTETIEEKEDSTPQHSQPSASSGQNTQEPARDEEQEKRKAGIKKYNEIVERMNNKDNEVTVVDFLNLLRTGIFDKEQAAVITEAIQKHLTIPEITEIAKPEQSSEVMEEILSFLLAAREGDIKKEERQERRERAVTKTINKRKVQTEIKKEEVSSAATNNSEEDDDYSF